MCAEQDGGERESMYRFVRQTLDSVLKKPRALVLMGELSSLCSPRGFRMNISWRLLPDFPIPSLGVPHFSTLAFTLTEHSCWSGERTFSGALLLMI